MNPSIIAIAASALFAACFGGLAWVLGRGVREAMQQVDTVYAEDTSRKLEDVFLFVPARRIAEFARIGAIVVFLAVFLVAGDFSSARGMLGGFLLGLGAAAAAIRSPALVLQIMRQRRLQRFNDQLVDALLQMSNALKAGFSILQGFESVVKEGRPPISQEFGLFLHQVRVGMRFEDALSDMETRVGSEDLTVTVRAIEVARLTGGNLTEVFESIAATIRERNRIQGRIRALTAQGRMQGWVVGLLPLLLLAALSALDPRMIRDFVTSVPGILLLCVVALLETAGAMLIRRIVRIDV